MPTRLVHVNVDAHDPPRLAAFWAAVLGWEATADEEEDVSYAEPAGFGYPDPVTLPLAFGPVPEPKTTKNRLHLDLASRSVEHQAAEVERLRKLGAVPVDVGQGDVPWVVLADPEGNEFCVLDPRPEYLGTGPVAAVVMDCADPGALAGFWETAAGMARTGGDEHIASLRAPQGVGPYLELLRTPGSKSVKHRIHLDVAPGKDEDHQAAVQQLRDLGAVPMDIGQGDVSWVVLADPAGNEFCVLTPR